MFEIKRKDTKDNLEDTKDGDQHRIQRNLSQVW